MVVFPFSVEGWNTSYLLHFCIGEEHVFWQSEHLAQVNYQPCGSLVIRRSSEIAYLVCTLQQHSCLQSRWCSCVSVFLISSLSQKKWTKSVKSWWCKDVFIRKTKGEFKISTTSVLTSIASLHVFLQGLHSPVLRLKDVPVSRVLKILLFFFFLD